MRQQKRNESSMFWKYVMLFSNLDVELQMEHKLLSYRQFKRVRNKEALIDLYKRLLYNGKNS